MPIWCTRAGEALRGKENILRICLRRPATRPEREADMNSLVRNIRETQIDAVTAADNFRNAMRSLAGGVSIMTVGSGNDLSGMTVTSVSSLSVEPATLIVSINRESSSWRLVQDHGTFGISILSADHVELAERFSGIGGLKGMERFAGSEWISLASGVPLLSDALAAFDCEVEHVVERHSHAIVIGRVLDLQMSPGKPALAYWQGQYVALDRNEDTPRLASIATER
jgi:flavin reductase (DIM6/NTAB) family NADH-FMN oxidoreductase RutF